MLIKKERTQLELLCMDKIPRLLNGELPEVVFGYAQSSPKYTESSILPDFATAKWRKAPNFLPDNEYPGD